MRTNELALSGVLSAFALAIPLLFKGWLQFVIPTVGYSATLASHVPVMLSIIAGPQVAALTGLASTLGFFVTLGPVVAARAATHILFGVVTAIVVKKGFSFNKAIFLIALPLHSIPEGLVVIPFGIPLFGAFINIVGGSIHHIIDAIVTIIVIRAARPVLKSFKFLE